MQGRTKPPEDADASGLRFAIVAAEFNRDVTERLVEGALAWLKDHGAAVADVHWVPGSFEIPLACGALAESGRYDALVAVGSVVRGETAHFEYVAGGATHGLMQVMLDSGVPVGFGILTTEDETQALARAGGEHGNKGAEAAATATRMARFLRDVAE